MFSDDDLIPISALQHYAFCPRQCALIHIERQWVENRLTAEGRVLHEKAHAGECELRDGVLTARGLALVSRRLGLAGQADVVEFHLSPDPAGVTLPGRVGRWRPFPVEYKRGRPKRGNCDEIQLCAQAMCLEEMLATTIQAGALFYGEPRRRKDVALSATLRGAAERAAGELHTLFDSRITPAPVNDERCRNCSLTEVCLPGAASRKRVLRWVEARLRAGE
ncbi:MAG: CRISPR-associated protein Cas4 [Bryobacteraceae bacterium]